MKHLSTFNLFFESIGDKPLYDQETRSMTGAYKLVSDKDGVTSIENYQEIPEIKGGKPLIYMDDKLSGIRVKKVVELPSDKIKIGEDLGGGYFEISIPYSLFKKHDADLEIKKLSDRYRVKDERIN